MIQILLAGTFFVGIHLLIAGTPLRDRLVARLGERAYLGLFSLLSIAGITWLCWAWSAQAPMRPWWNGRALLPVVWVGVFVAFELAAIGLTTPSPTATGGEALLGRPEPARGILRITRHPFLWGVALWSVLHCIANPDPPSLLFFGSFGVLALIGPPSIDAKRARKHGEAWERFAAVTSSLPFAAIARGRNRFEPGELGIWRIALGAGLFGVFLWLHPKLFGVCAV